MGEFVHAGIVTSVHGFFCPMYHFLFTYVCILSDMPRYKSIHAAYIAHTCSFKIPSRDFSGL